MGGKIVIAGSHLGNIFSLSSEKQIIFVTYSYYG